MLVAQISKTKDCLSRLELKICSSAVKEEVHIALESYIHNVVYSCIIMRSGYFIQRRADAQQLCLFLHWWSF
jgi:hypothetical protein